MSRHTETRIGPGADAPPPYLGTQIVCPPPPPCLLEAKCVCGSVVEEKKEEK
jgi:hypothetical protein